MPFFYRSVCKISKLVLSHLSIYVTYIVKWMLMQGNITGSSRYVRLFPWFLMICAPPTSLTISMLIHKTISMLIHTETCKQNNQSNRIDHHSFYLSCRLFSIGWLKIWFSTIHFIITEQLEMYQREAMSEYLSPPHKVKRLGREEQRFQFQNCRSGLMHGPNAWIFQPPKPKHV